MRNILFGYPVIFSPSDRIMSERRERGDRARFSKGIRYYYGGRGVFLNNDFLITNRPNNNCIFYYFSLCFFIRLPALFFKLFLMCLGDPRPQQGRGSRREYGSRADSHPPGLRGREIGLFYAQRNKEKRLRRDDAEVIYFQFGKP